VAVVFVVALAVWWIQALVIPLAEGRDLGTYLGAYVQLFHGDPVDLGYVIGRTPLAPLVIGGLLDFRGGALAEPVMSLLYAASVVAWFLAARTFSTRAAVLTAVVLLAYPGYGILFHELSSDAVFAAAFAGWSLLVVHTLRTPTWRRFACVGAGVGVLTLIRPSNQILLVLALLPLALRVTWRARAAFAVAFLVPALALLGGWVLNNGLRYGDYILVRGGNATVPFYRAFVTDRIVRPSNGSKTRELARAVQRDLLPKEPYRSYGITLDDFFRHASPRMEVDLVALSDRLKGWYTNDRWLRDVGVEAVRAHPGTYTRGVAGSTWGLLKDPLYRTPSPSTTVTPGTTSSGATGASLPTPSEGEPIPAPHEGGITTPDRSIYTVWTSPTKHHMVFVHPEDEARNAFLHRRMAELAANLPDRRGSPSLAHRFNQLSKWFPPPVLWLVLGLIGLVLWRSREEVALATPTVAGLLVIVLSAAGLPAEPHYSVPVAPAFVLLAGGALFAPRRALGFAGWRACLAELGPPAGLVAGVLAAVWAVKHYVTLVHDYLDSHGAPHDLAVFLRAAGHVIHGSSPYAFHADQTYAYPPLLAFLAAPLHPLDAGVATLLWTLVSLAAIAAALWLLGLRDWRCYALAAVYPFTRSAVDLGTVGPLLLLAVAAAWRWRDEVLRPAVAVGAGVALKLFLWPLAVWLAATRRIGAAVAAAGAAVVLALVSWAAIGFDGIGDYPHLLRRLSDDEATSSYSAIALGVRAHLPKTAATVIALIVAAALLAAAVWVARDNRRTARDRDVAVLTLALAAAFAVSPIVWIHYFLLLLVPLALTQPRLSLLWLVPFAYEPLGESAWPAGDARKLGIALVATLVLLGAGLLEGTGGWKRISVPSLRRDREEQEPPRFEPAELPKP
jgi:Glycosyltransferase family 87/Dolichyl-phosphate-mannose-protein mannosyltransferase